MHRTVNLAFGPKLSKTPPMKVFFQVTPQSDFLAASLHGKSQTTQIFLQSMRSVPAFPFMSLQKDVGTWSCMLLQAQLPALASIGGGLGNLPF